MCSGQEQDEVLHTCGLFPQQQKRDNQPCVVLLFTDFCFGKQFIDCTKLLQQCHAKNRSDVFFFTYVERK